MNIEKIFSGKFWLMGLLVAFIATSCGSDDPEKQAARDRKKILEYIQKHQLDAQELPSGVFYVIEEPGTGDYPTENSIVSLNYTGRLLSGKIFDSGYNRTFNLRQTILGFRYGVPMFNRGSRGLLLIPSGLGYGPYGSFAVPPNAVLIFEIEVIDFN